MSNLTPDPTGNDFPPVHWLLDQGSSLGWQGQLTTSPNVLNGAPLILDRYLANSSYEQSYISYIFPLTLIVKRYIKIIINQIKKG
jgi:hypothetical protein